MFGTPDENVPETVDPLRASRSSPCASDNTLSEAAANASASAVDTLRESPTRICAPPADCRLATALRAVLAPPGSKLYDTEPRTTTSTPSGGLVLVSIRVHVLPVCWTRWTSDESSVQLLRLAERTAAARTVLSWVLADEPAMNLLPSRAARSADRCRAP